MRKPSVIFNRTGFSIAGIMPLSSVSLVMGQSNGNVVGPGPYSALTDDANRSSSGGNQGRGLLGTSGLMQIPLNKLLHISTSPKRKTFTET